MYFIAHNIKYLRKKHRLSLNDIAERISIPKSTMASYEEGRAKPKEDTLKKLSQLFGEDAKDLMFKNLERSYHNNKSTEPGNLNGTDTYKKPPGGTIQMNDLILLTIEQLFKLQSEQEDITAVKSIQQVIAYKQYCESLERENKLLKEMIDILKQKKK